MNKSQRLLELLLTVNTRQKYTLKELSNRFGVSKRTILRDINELSSLGVPLYSELGVHGGYRVIKERTLPPLSFTEKEATALYFAVQSLQYFHSLPMESDWKSALAKFYSVLPEDIRERLNKLQQRLLFWIPVQTWEAPHLADLLEGAIDQKVYHIRYESVRGISERDVQLIGLYSMNGRWYCPAFDFLSNQYRLFRADRVISLSVSSNQVQKKNFDEFPITDWFRKEMQHEEENERYELSVRLTKKGVLLCKNDAWLAEGLIVTKDGSGMIQRKMTSGYLDWAASFFLSCGAEAIVEAPSELQQMIRRHLDEMASLYKKEVSSE
ncbi:helix-turn-helix transcriptional regulator [Brevibacillus sp. SYSU BS000544]|uniref:helix-turn-helix transcriptional regulator n=1 Tax=Brevibacillus sp. SYSU BS000544 TaxID=3416443 RepID=UPI003CE5AD38